MLNLIQLYNKPTAELRRLKDQLGEQLQQMDKEAATAQEQRTQKAGHLREVDSMIQQREKAGVG